MKTFLLLLVVVLPAFGQSLQQDWSTELSLKASYSRFEKDFEFYTDTPVFGFGETYDAFTLRAGAAKQLMSRVSVALEPTYSLLHVTKRTLHYFSLGNPLADPGEEREVSWYHKIGIRTGITYALPLREGIDVTFGGKVGMQWLRYERKTTYASEFRWGKPEYVLPSVMAGMRVFAEGSWALLFEAEYSWIKGVDDDAVHPFEYPYPRYYVGVVEVGFGVAIYP
jgi:hypothetical protein